MRKREAAYETATTKPRPCRVNLLLLTTCDGGAGLLGFWKGSDRAAHAVTGCLCWAGRDRLTRSPPLRDKARRRDDRRERADRDYDPGRPDDEFAGFLVLHTRAHAADRE